MGNPHIERLWLQSVDLEEDILSTIFRTNSWKYTVKIMWITYCKLGDNSVKTISELLKGNKKVTSLNLENNEIGEEGANHLVKLLRYGCVIKKLRTEFIRPKYQ